MAKIEEKKPELEVEVKAQKVEAVAAKVEPKPSLEGLVKMKREDKIIHAHPTVVKEHEKNGWKHA